VVGCGCGGGGKAAIQYKVKLADGTEHKVETVQEAQSLIRTAKGGTYRAVPKT
jgi:hypothetical protein